MQPPVDEIPHHVSPESRVRIPQHVVRRDFPAQTVVLNLHTGRYHGLNPTAGTMLAALEETSNLGAAAKLVAERFGQPRGEVLRDLYELCGNLLDRGLIELAEMSGS
jgi:hypothetical protein